MWYSGKTYQWSDTSVAQEYNMLLISYVSRVKPNLTDFNPNEILNWCTGMTPYETDAMKSTRIMYRTGNLCCSNQSIYLRLLAADPSTDHRLQITYRKDLCRTSKHLWDHSDRMPSSIPCTRRLGNPCLQPPNLLVLQLAYSLGQCRRGNDRRSTKTAIRRILKSANARSLSTVNLPGSSS